MVLQVFFAATSIALAEQATREITSACCRLLAEDTAYHAGENFRIAQVVTISGDHRYLIQERRQGEITSSFEFTPSENPHQRLKTIVAPHPQSAGCDDYLKSLLNSKVQVITQAEEVCLKAESLLEGENFIQLLNPKLEIRKHSSPDGKETLYSLVLLKDKDIIQHIHLYYPRRSGAAGCLISSIDSDNFAAAVKNIHQSIC